MPRPLDEAQVAALLEQLRSLRDRAIVLLMLQGGLRSGEVLGLHLEDIAYGRRRLRCGPARSSGCTWRTSPTAAGGYGAAP
jgi:integrase